MLILLFFDEIIFEGIVVGVAWWGIVFDDDEDGSCVEQSQYEQDDVEDGVARLFVALEEEEKESQRYFAYCPAHQHQNRKVLSILVILLHNQHESQVIQQPNAATRCDIPSVRPHHHQDGAGSPQCREYLEDFDPAEVVTGVSSHQAADTQCDEHE